MDQYEREEQAIEEDHANGHISLKEYNRELRELQAQREEEAMNAYNHVMGRW